MILNVIGQNVSIKYNCKLPKSLQSAIFSTLIYLERDKGFCIFIFFFVIHTHKLSNEPKCNNSHSNLVSLKKSNMWRKSKP